MKKFLEEIKMAKKLEWFLLLTVAAMLLLVAFKDTAGSANLRNETEQRLISVLNRIHGVGKNDALITELNGRTSILVIAEGAEDMEVYLRILQAVRMMFNSDVSDIEIIPHKG